MMVLRLFRWVQLESALPFCLESFVIAVSEPRVSAALEVVVAHLLGIGVQVGDDGPGCVVVLIGAHGAPS